MNEFRLVSKDRGPLRMGDLFRIEEFLLMHQIPADAEIVEIKTEPFWDYTQLIVSWKIQGRV